MTRLLRVALQHCNFVHLGFEDCSLRLPRHNSAEMVKPVHDSIATADRQSAGVTVTVNELLRALPSFLKSQNLSNSHEEYQTPSKSCLLTRALALHFSLVNKHSKLVRVGRGQGVVSLLKEVCTAL